MTIKEVHDKFRKDTLWLMSELKQEELANAYSEYQIKYFMRQLSEDEPNIVSQRRIFKMLSDREAIRMTPAFHRLAILDSALQMQGMDPIGYYLQVKQPRFDEIFEEISNQTEGSAPVIKQEQKTRPAASPDDRYFISVNKKRQVMLNDIFILSTPNFNGENERFIEYVIAHPDEKLTKASMESELKVKIKKSFHSILSDLGFKGEVRKLFFDVSKNAVQFRNLIAENEMTELGIDAKKLAAELSVLGGNNKKEEEMDTNEDK